MYTFTQNQNYNIIIDMEKRILKEYLGIDFDQYCKENNRLQ